MLLSAKAGQQAGDLQVGYMHSGNVVYQRQNSNSKILASLILMHNSMLNSSNDMLAVLVPLLCCVGAVP